jgi:hypothetical protein
MKNLKKMFVIAETIGGWNQRPLFTGTYPQCEKMMEKNPSWGYGTSTMKIHPADEYNVHNL